MRLHLDTEEEAGTQWTQSVFAGADMLWWRLRSCHEPLVMPPGGVRYHVLNRASGRQTIFRAENDVI